MHIFRSENNLFKSVSDDFNQGWQNLLPTQRYLSCCWLLNQKTFISNKYI